jgi:hypothetical protein
VIISLTRLHRAGYCLKMTDRQSITFEERYFGAKATAIVLKAFAILWLIAGVLIIFRTDSTYSNNGSGLSLLIVIAIEAASTLLGAAMFAFFGYVLDLLRGIWEETAGEYDSDD